MSTRSTPVLDAIAEDWRKVYPSAVFSGIVGDTEHEQRGGYHISIEDQTSSINYSVVRPDDKAPPGAWPRDRAAAIDMNLKLADMKLCHARLKAVWMNRASDPRARFINAWNGWDGEGSPGRYDMVTGTVSTASDDHEWHVHLEVRRRYVNSLAAQTAILSIVSGQSLAAYLRGEDVALSLTIDDREAIRQEAAEAVVGFFRGAWQAATGQTVGDTDPLNKTKRAYLLFLRAAIGGPVDQGVLMAAIMAENSLTAEDVAAALAPKIVIPDGSELTVDEVAEAVKQALREGTGTP